MFSNCSNWTLLKLKKIPTFKEIKKLSTEAVSAISHAVSALCQQRKDAIKVELDNKIINLFEPAHQVSTIQLFGDNMNGELKELILRKCKIGLSPQVKYFTDRSKAVFLLLIFYVFVLSCVCYVFVRVCLYVLCGHLLGKG